MGLFFGFFCVIFVFSYFFVTFCGQGLWLAFYSLGFLAWKIDRSRDLNPAGAFSWTRMIMIIFLLLLALYLWG
jgi:hypothetical protein